MFCAALPKRGEYEEQDRSYPYHPSLVPLCETASREPAQVVVFSELVGEQLAESLTDVLLLQAGRVSKKHCMHLKTQPLQHLAAAFVKLHVRSTLKKAVKTYAGWTMILFRE